jgi:twitching motility two-component system response regulator PilH
VKRVLIVDDSRTQQMYTRRLLEQHGYETLMAADGEIGIEYARSARPDVILMDVVMPRMNGFQATRRINQDPLTTDIPVIIVSGKDMASDRAWGMRQGARDYITKPYTDSELVERIETILNTHSKAA